MYKDKLISVDKALGLVKSGDVIVSASVAGEAKLFLENLHSIADRVKDVTVTTCLPMAACEYFMDAKYKESFGMDGWFYTAPMRKMQGTGMVSFIPNHLHLAGIKRLAFKNHRIYVGNATLPDKHGNVSLSLSNIYERLMLEAAEIVILELNPKLPRTFGNVNVHLSDVDYVIEADYDIPSLPDVEPNEKDLKIGKLIAERINDGDCIQLGIGGIPNAVAQSLMGKKDLGIHTEMMTSGMVDLIKAGVVNNSKKQVYKGKSVCCFALGNQKLYDYLDDNPSVLVLDGLHTNDPYVIGQNDNQVSINTTIEIDLTGQCASESIGHVQYSGTGGQADTAIGAQISKNGRSFIALYSTAQVKNKETGEKETISKIVPTLKEGAIVSLSRADVDMVVTEYGVAELRGTAVKDRVERLIAIAAPEFREELYAKAKEMAFI